MIPDDAATKLAELARREFRAPRQQAAALLVEAIKRAGLDQDHRPEASVEPSVAKPARSRRASRTAARTGAQDRAG